jgi:quinol monooxygenase YgiN
MYGLISQIITAPGKREELVHLLLDGATDMPGCFAYIVAADRARTDAVWITEVWIDKASHDKSLSLPRARAAIAKGRPLIVGVGSHVETTPLGGHGLVARWKPDAWAPTR